MEIIRFRHGDWGMVRKTMLADREIESFAVGLASRQDISGTTVIVVHEIRFPAAEDYESRSLGHVKLRKEFIHRMLVEAVSRLDVDTIVDIHTHPQDTDHVCFSSIDNRDEERFSRFLARFDNINYASIVLSGERYQARLWEIGVEPPQPRKALVKTPTVFEAIPESEEALDCMNTEPNEMQARTILALGLDNCRRIARNQKIVLAGVGGLGSVMAEHLVHMGFVHIGLIDPDYLELHNLNRFVGGTYLDAIEKRPKVEVVARHLKGINPEIRTETSQSNLKHSEAQRMMAEADFILLSTDTHTSRLECQRTAQKFSVPLISAGVNISVEDGIITDMSGEVITMRPGDNFCLSCLGRINLAKIAVESHPDEAVREATVRRGYVTGLDVKEPAVKTLNSIVGTLAVEALLDQYLKPTGNVPILVYENNGSCCIYPDRESFNDRITGCSLCSLE